jgi:dUTP pyrophosphatase
LFSTQSLRINSGDHAKVRTGIALGIPPNVYIRIAPRSGLAANHGIHVGAGVVDRDYTGEIAVVLFNLGQQDYNVYVGDKIAQIICERYAHLSCIKRF